jgi:hypothetical protein
LDFHDLLLYPGDAVCDPAPVFLQFHFARPAGPNPGSQPREGGSFSAQARQEVGQPGQLNLEFALVAPGPPGEDVEDQLRPVDDFRFDPVFQASLLDGAEVVIEDDEVGLEFLLEASQLFGLPLADEVSGTDPRPVLEDPVHDSGPRRRGQVGQFFDRFLGLRFLLLCGRQMHQDRFFHG